MPLYALTIFVSAFLLFLVQPVMAKQILPWFGGSSTVWTTCLVFFQTTLLLGYAYADWVVHRRTLLRNERARQRKPEDRSFIEASFPLRNQRWEVRVVAGAFSISEEAVFLFWFRSSSRQRSCLGGQEKSVGVQIDRQIQLSAQKRMLCTAFEVTKSRRRYVSRNKWPHVTLNVGFKS